MKRLVEKNSNIIDGGIIIAKIKNGYQIIQIEKITFCVADGSYSTIFFDDYSKVVVCNPLIITEKLLNSSNFIRCHNSYLVNINKVEKFDYKKKIMTVCGQNIPVSRRKCYCTIMKLRNYVNSYL